MGYEILSSLKLPKNKRIEVKFMEICTNDIPKIFWKYFDLYRRKKITLSQYAERTGFTRQEISAFLNEVDEKKSKIR